MCRVPAARFRGREGRAIELERAILVALQGIPLRINRHLHPECRVTGLVLTDV
jgi:hypothetical protein